MSIFKIATFHLKTAQLSHIYLTCLYLLHNDLFLAHKFDVFSFYQQSRKLSRQKKMHRCVQTCVVLQINSLTTIFI